MEIVVESDREESVGGELSPEEDCEETLNLNLTHENKDELHPESYRANSPEEIRMLNIANNFQRQYSYLFPERKPLLLSPLNECGVKKFVSTTLRMTSTGLHELYTWEGCASFVADFLSLVPLDPPEDLPRTLFSPTSVLQSQRATCFESASLLCSLLIGIDYNAYCVSGFAVKEMCLQDQSRQECPLLDTPVKSVIPPQEQPENKYSLKLRKELKSHFFMQEEKKKRDAEAALLQKQKLEESELQSEQPPADPLRGLRRHCWVLVLLGSRGVQETFFIDPLTGKRFSTDDDNFLGIDSVWDNFNYYANMQDCSNGCANMVYDLDDLNLWEPVLFGATSKKQLSLELSLRKERKMRMNNNDNVEKKPHVFEMPISWVDHIHISKKDLEERSPGQEKMTLYRKAKLEKFAIYLRRDGLVTRLTTYKDLNWTEELKVKEWYQNRKDHLKEREINKVNGITSDRFKHGRSFHLIHHRFTDTEHEMLFSKARVDNLVRRVESPSELKEYYEGRADLLYFRYAVFDFRESSKDNNWLLKVVERFHRNSTKPANQDIAERVFLLAHNRIEVTYHLDDHRVIPTKRSFIKPQKATSERKAEEFTRDMTTCFEGGLVEKPLSTLALYRIMKALKEEEEQVVEQVIKSRQSVRDIVACRQREDKNVELSFSPWTTIGAAQWHSMRQEREHLAKEEQRWHQEREDDILATFSKYLDHPEGLDSTKAKELYQKCLSNYKQRLEEKANIIQERYDKETQELQRMQQRYQKNQLTMTDQQVVEYQTECSNKMLQIHVTKERLKMQKVSATERYSALDEKLKQDPRLKPYLKG